MNRKDQFVAFIPVRGGSKSIPLKNIKPINGRPLVYWVMDSAIQCSSIDKVYISTDSTDIARFVDEYKKNTPGSEKLSCIERAAYTATDTARTESAMLDFADRYDFEHLLLIQATSPLLTHRHLEEAIEIYQKGGYDSLLSVVRQKRFLWEDTKEGARPMNYHYLSRPRRQEFDGYFVENGAFYIITKKLLLESKCRIFGKIGIYEMEAETYFEIDELADWYIIENLMSRRNKDKTKIINNKIKLFATDCDGCLTDGGMYYSETGDELKRFNSLDGMGFGMLRNHNIKTAIITGEDTQIVKNRAAKLQVDYLFMGVHDKLNVLKCIAKEMNISMDEIAYFGDDINDVEVLNQVGLSFCVPRGCKEAKEAADVIVSLKGGDGAVREAIEYVLNMR
jgi:N-acylneuraminate cytidylyltransferase